MPPNYTMKVRKNGTITMKSRGDFDLRRVPFLQQMGLPPPDGEPTHGALLAKPAKCPCGAELPWHLVAIADKRFSHVCSCRNGYAWEDSITLRFDGKKQNPFADYDEAITKAK